jgi:HK97 family phage prohead protease
MGKITVVTGPPASGKSTHVSESAEPGDVTVDFDSLAVSFGAKRNHDASADIKTVTFAARDAAIQAILAGVKSDAWIIHTQPTKAQSDAYELAGAEIVRLDPGIDVVLERAAADDRPEWTAEAIANWYARQNETPKEGKMKTKNLSAQVKATGDDTGEFEAIVAVFGNVDSGGDVIAKGAFADNLSEWEASGDPIPVVWSHDSNDPFSHIGSVVEASETDTGLLVKGQLDLDNPKAAQVHKLLKGRRVTQFSFAYSVLDAGPTEVDGVKATELRRLKLYEVGPTLVGMNQSTELLSAKSDDVDAKAGRVLSAKNVQVVNDAITAADALKSALKALLDGATNDDGKASTGQQVKDEEPPAAKSEEPPASVPAVDISSWDTYLKALSLEEML